MSQQQSYFTGLHYNKSNYESNEDNILASDVIETTSKIFLTNSSQTLDGTKTFTNGIDLATIKCNGVEFVKNFLLVDSITSLA